MTDIPKEIIRQLELNDEFRKETLRYILATNKRIAELERTIRFFNKIHPIVKTDRSYTEAPKVHKPKLLSDRRFFAEERVWRKKKRGKKVGQN
jgi:hypothetical protein